MILRHRDGESLRFEWVRDVRVRILSVNADERRSLPLEDWLASRSAPVGRHFMRSLMDSLGLNINSPDYPRKAPEFSLGLSLNDVHWVVPDDFRGTWAEFNRYDKRN